MVMVSLLHLRRKTLRRRGKSFKLMNVECMRWYPDMCFFRDQAG